MRKFILITIMILTLGTLSGCLRQPKYDPIKDVLDTLTVRTQTAESFELVVLKDNVELTWTSNSNSIKIEDTTAVVTQGKEDTSVTLKVVASKGELKGEKAFNVTVLRDVNFPETLTIEESYTAADNSYVKYLDVTACDITNEGAYFTDGEKVIFVKGVSNIVKGNTYEVVGKKITNEIAMLENSVVTPLSTSSKTLNPTQTLLSSLPNTNGYFAVTGKLRIENEKLYITENDKKIEVINNNNLDLFVDKLVSMKVYILGNNKVRTFSTTEDLGLSNNVILDVVSNNLELVEYTKTNIRLSNTSLFNTTISWASNNESTISNTGVVTRQNNNTTVTLTATISLNGTSVTKSFNVVVIEESNDYVDDLFISEYYEGTGYNKYIEIYNPTNMTVDLSDYSIKLSKEGKEYDNELQLSGELLANETYVIYSNDSRFSVEIKELLNQNKSIASNVVNFNGDDTIGLFKEDVLIDIFGVYGEDPGASWPVGGGSTVDHRIVRNKYTGSNINWDVTEWTATKVTSDSFQLDNLGLHLFV